MPFFWLQSLNWMLKSLANSYGACTASPLVLAITFLEASYPTVVAVCFGKASQPNQAVLTVCLAKKVRKDSQTAGAFTKTHWAGDKSQHPKDDPDCEWAINTCCPWQPFGCHVLLVSITCAQEMQPSCVCLSSCCEYTLILCKHTLSCSAPQHPICREGDDNTFPPQRSS